MLFITSPSIITTMLENMKDANICRVNMSLKVFFYTFFTITLFSTFLNPQISRTEDIKGAPSVQPGPDPIITDEESKIEFEYVLENRPDPFMPFITEKATTPTTNPDEIIETEVDLTGMRQFEPGQLTLVAVLSSKALKMAMVEDVTGKGYIINEGTPIGRRGVVTEIQEDKVLVTETAHTRSGKELVNTIIMRLNKEGE